MEEESKENSTTDEVSKDFEPPTPQSNEITIEISRSDFHDFIVEESNKYLTKFSKFYANGRDKFAFTWNWSAFLFTILWMVYIKLYGWALAAYFLSFVPFINILLWPVVGVTGNYLYYKHAKKKILNLKTTQTFSTSSQMSQALNKIGGVNKRAVFFVFVLGMVIQVLFRRMLAQ